MLQRMLMRARCHRVARVLQSYLDGEVDPPTATAVAEHLELCRRCGLEASTYTAIKTAITAGDSVRRERINPTTLARLDQFARGLATHENP